MELRLSHTEAAKKQLWYKNTTTIFHSRNDFVNSWIQWFHNTFLETFLQFHV